MKISKFLKDIFLLLICFVFLLIAYLIASKISRPPIVVSKQDSTLNVSSKLTQYFHMGQKRLISSSIWIATILESDLEHYKQKDMNSWMFLRFKSISELEPRFYENYRVGAVYLSIVKDDLIGASYIYDKGLAEFPTDYVLLKNAAFHNEFELGNQERSHEIYNQLIKHPEVDPLTLSVALRSQSQFGSKQIAFDLLWDQFKRLPKDYSVLRQKMQQNLYDLKAEIDLECLNEKKSSCSKLDFYNESYIFDGNTYRAKSPWTPFRLNKRKKKPRT